MIFDGCKEDGAKLPRKLRVLTWSPLYKDAEGDTRGFGAIELFRKTLGENAANPARTHQQLSSAIEKWHELQKTFGKEVIEVRKYQPIPTMQGMIVTSQNETESWAQIELLPYRTKPEDRPALLLKLKKDQELFKLFQEKWELLWRDAKE